MYHKLAVKLPFMKEFKVPVGIQTHSREGQDLFEVNNINK
jgi:hypothetical protein